MKRKLAGIALLLTGVLAIIYTGFTFSAAPRIINLGLVKINTETDASIQLLPIFGIIMLIAGIMKIFPKIKAENI